MQSALLLTKSDTNHVLKLFVLGVMIRKQSHKKEEKAWGEETVGY